VIGASTHRRHVFEAVCAGRKAVKTVDDLAAATGLTRKQVLNAAKSLVHNDLFDQTRQNGDTGYVRDAFLLLAGRRSLRSRRIEGSCRNFRRNSASCEASDRSRAVAEKSRSGQDRYCRRYSVPAGGPKRESSGATPTIMPETQFKQGFQAVIGEQGTCKDWGGERNDLLDHTPTVEVDARQRGSRLQRSWYHVRRRRC
jgi:hypothetical protein